MPVLIKFSAVNKNNIKIEHFTAIYDDAAEDQYNATKNWIKHRTKDTSSTDDKELDISNYTFTDITSEEFAILHKLFGGSYGYVFFGDN